MEKEMEKEKNGMEKVLMKKEMKNIQLKMEMENLKNIMTIIL